jgi:hypothetical protein
MEDEHQGTARVLFALHALVGAEVIAGQTYLFDFRVLLLETALGSVDSALDTRRRLMSDILPEPGSPAMPDPVEFVCAGCGATFVCDRTPEAARAEVKLCSGCAFPEVRGV